MREKRNRSLRILLVVLSGLGLVATPQVGSAHELDECGVELKPRFVDAGSDQAFRAVVMNGPDWDHHLAPVREHQPDDLRVWTPWMLGDLGLKPIIFFRLHVLDSGDDPISNLSAEADGWTITSSDSGYTLIWESDSSAADPPKIGFSGIRDLSFNADVSDPTEDFTVRFSAQYKREGDTASTACQERYSNSLRITVCADGVASDGESCL